jgi:phosphoribosylglycinamide formyltransferase-1
MTGRVAVLVSGSGTNLQALLDDEAIVPHVALVLSDRPGVTALARASSRGIETIVRGPAGDESRATYTDAVRDALIERGIDTVVLAGYLRVLGPTFFDAFPNRVLNVHPALLPSFPGAHAVRDALAWGVKVTGVTVHLVDEQVDHGPIVLQRAVEIHDGDDEDALTSRIHDVEHRLLPAAVRALLGGRVTVEGRVARIDDREEPPR